MSELVEKVARALCVASGDLDPDIVFTGWNEPAWKDWKPNARAAIAAVAEWLEGEGRDIAATQLRAAAGSALEAKP